MKPGLISLSMLAGTLLISLAGEVHARSVLTLPKYEVGSVFIYSDGHVEKLVRKLRDSYVVEDMRKRRYRRDMNFTIPPLEYTSFDNAYRQQVISGDPSAILPLERSRRSTFQVKRERNNGETRVSEWSCGQAQPLQTKVMRQSLQVIHVACRRISRNIFKGKTRLRETVEYDYDPATGWVVKRVRTSGFESRSRTLLAVLPPKKATVGAISRELRKTRR